MNVLRHTVVFSWKDGRLCIWPVLRRWDPFVTGSLLFVALERRQATLGSCRIVPCLSPVSAVELLRAVNGFSRVVFVNQSGSVMATGGGQVDMDKPGRDIPILQKVGVTLDSAKLYNLDLEWVPDVLGLHARSPEAWT